MNFWKSQKDRFIPDPTAVTEEQDHKYQLWKSHFTRNIEEYYEDKKNKIEDFYGPRIDAVREKYPFEKTTAPVTMLIRDIIDSGFDLKLCHTNPAADINGYGYTFKVNEMLNPPSEEAATLMARFLSEFYHYIDLEASCSIDMQLVENSPTITYYILVQSLDVIGTPIKDHLKFRKSPNADNEISRDLFEEDFKRNLETYWNNIEEEINRYKAK